MVGIIDYGMGNLRSVLNAFRFLGAEARIITRPEELRDAARIVLPGVGAFGDGVRHLRERGFVEALNEEVRGRGKPFLGICLGMQLLAVTGMEFGPHAGLGWVDGVVGRFPEAVAATPLRVPHVGWNDVCFRRTDGMYAGLGRAQAFYFVHSYMLPATEAAAVNGVCSYGLEFAASLEIGNVWATQFHPEKSHQAGLAVLRNFAGRE
jgi:glutamine amidotransferase